MPNKSTVDQIRARFDNDVERFSNLETGQTAVIDPLVVLELLPRVALAATPNARSFLDVGCGAGNFSLKMRHQAPGIAITLIDLSRPMLDRAMERLGRENATSLQGDIRDLELGVRQFDIVVAAASLHHLRGDEEWRAVFAKIYHSLRPGGGFWISDMVEHSLPAVHDLMWTRYGEYLESLGGETYREKVFDYIEAEDTPRPMVWQLDRMREAGFAQLEIIHKNGPFAAFGGVKPG